MSRVAMGSMHSKFPSLLKSEAGSVTMLLALALPAVLGLVGAATDYAAVTQARTQLQTAADGAALAVAREMTVAATNQARAQALATSFVGANADPANAPTVTATLVENGLAVKISVQQRVKTPLGLIAALGGVDTLNVSALARVTAASMQSKLCMLSLGTKDNGGIFMHNGASVTAPECVIHSNSKNKEAIIVQQNSKITANLICSRGGLINSAGMINAQTLTDCPVIADPLAKKPEPQTKAPCQYLTQIIMAGIRTLNPGTYCNGVFIFGNAKVTLNPGIYVFRDGPFLVASNAEVLGAGVTLMLTGKSSYLHLHDNALVRLSAPTSGISAGMLVWESKNWEPGSNSWEVGGCGSKPSGTKESYASSGGFVPATESEDAGPVGCYTALSRLTNLLKKTNEHHINSDRAQELTGTIYLPRGLLLIDSNKPVAEQSPFTVMVVNKLDLFDGPNLVLNTNYGGTSVPVPAGLGAIGATRVRLGAETAAGAAPTGP